MGKTSELIDDLAAGLQPVKPLRPVWQRVTGWLTLVAAVAAGMIALRGPGIAAMGRHLSGHGVVIELLAAASTGLLATIAAFHVSVPGRSRWWAWLPVPALLFWVGSQGFGCLQQLSSMGPDALAWSDDGFECARAIALVGIPLGVAQIWFLRHAGQIRPTLTALLSAVGCAGLTAAAVSLIHRGETALMVLCWHVGMVALLALVASMSARRVFAWMGR